MSASFIYNCSIENLILKCKHGFQFNNKGSKRILHKLTWSKIIIGDTHIRNVNKDAKSKYTNARLLTMFMKNKVKHLVCLIYFEKSKLIHYES